MGVARKAIIFIRRHLYNDQTHRLQHSFRNGPSKAPGFLDDYDFLISGLLDLYECGGEIFWLAWAIELQDTQARTSLPVYYFLNKWFNHCFVCSSIPLNISFFQDELFLDREGGGYFNTPGEDPSVLLRVKEDHDGAEPSGNSVSATNLVRLASMVSGNRSEGYRRQAEHLLVCASS